MKTWKKRFWNGLVPILLAAVTQSRAEAQYGVVLLPPPVTYTEIGPPILDLRPIVIPAPPVVVPAEPWLISNRPAFPVPPTIVVPEIQGPISVSRGPLWLPAPPYHRPRLPFSPPVYQSHDGFRIIVR